MRVTVIGFSFNLHLILGSCINEAWPGVCLNIPGRVTNYQDDFRIPALLVSCGQLWPGVYIYYITGYEQHCEKNVCRSSIGYSRIHQLREQMPLVWERLQRVRQYHFLVTAGCVSIGGQQATYLTFSPYRRRYFIFYDLETFPKIGFADARQALQNAIG